MLVVTRAQATARDATEGITEEEVDHYYIWDELENYGNFEIAEARVPI